MGEPRYSHVPSRLIRNGRAPHVPARPTDGDGAAFPVSKSSINCVNPTLWKLLDLI
ncbi:hypothetical protein SXCC_03791 [Gluconacetobacter sp. SXCC-1]|nr:hypothetical protein SXCC_03791 [Gluconacetobacter sp. SXCC-1]